MLSLSESVKRSKYKFSKWHYTDFTHILHFKSLVGVYKSDSEDQLYNVLCGFWRSCWEVLNNIICNPNDISSPDLETFTHSVFITEVIMGGGGILECVVFIILSVSNNMATLTLMRRTNWGRFALYKV